MKERLLEGRVEQNFPLRSLLRTMSPMFDMTDGDDRVRARDKPECDGVCTRFIYPGSCIPIRNAGSVVIPNVSEQLDSPQ